MQVYHFKTVPCHRFRAGQFLEIRDTVAQEIELTIVLDNGPEQRLFASPLHLETLALGYALLELAAPLCVPEIQHMDQGYFEMVSQKDVRPIPNSALPLTLPAAELVGLMRKFIAAPGLWDNTGCFHRAALYDTQARDFVAWAEDIGRHNCLDRLVGECLIKGIQPAELILFLSCRVTASMMDKAARAGSRLIVSRSAVSDAAIARATEVGATLIGFARESEERLTIFADPGQKVMPRP